jgi:CRISPR/Cas system-associated exonuclease Cas4 (RecB family)
MLRLIHATLPEREKDRYASFEQYKKYIAGSWINTYYFCPYQLYLYRVKGIKRPATKAMKTGTAVHLALEQKHLEQVEEELMIEDALFNARMTRNAYVFRELHLIGHFERYQVGGYIDELAIYPDRVEVIDDKPGTQAYRGEIMQVHTYAHAFIKELSPGMPVWAVIRNRDTGEILYRNVHGAQKEEETEALLGDILALLRDARVPSVEVKESRCRSCRYRDVCEYYLSLYE